MRYRTCLAVTVLALVATPAAVAVAFTNPLHWFSEAQAPPTVTPHPPVASAGGTLSVAPGVPSSFAPIARAARPAVVNVSTTQTVRTQGGPQFGPGAGPFAEQDPFSEFFRHFFPQQPRSFTQRALGSGVLVDAAGHIVTNAHVVKGADKIVVKLEDKREFDAKVVGIDEKTDVAVLKIEPVKDLHFAALGDSDQLHVGDWVVAIGNPFGLSETVTAGIVSAKGRVIGEGPYDDFIQTDASINPGNSGGPLLNLQGQVVGINAAIFSQSGGNIGIGFAIPINLVKHVVEEIEAHGKVVRGWLGVSIQNVTPALAKSFGLTQAEGALVADVTPDSPAARAGVERGDIIVEYNGTHIGEAHQLPGLVAATTIGKTVPITVRRKDSTEHLSVTVAEMPANTQAATPRRTAERDWGLGVANITPDLAQQFNLAKKEGVVIVAVTPDSPADNAGLQPGDVIAQVDHRTVRSVAEYERALNNAGDSNQLLLLVTHQGQNLFVALSRSQ
ncbi:MAG: DegQ family serine endoprotease [Candidatus Binatia bacterium]